MSTEPTTKLPAIPPLSSSDLLGSWTDAAGNRVTMGEDFSDGIMEYCGLALIHTDSDGWHYKIGAYRRNEPNKEVSHPAGGKE
jgi:hypothetical protein